MSDVVAVRSPIVGTVVRVAVGPGDVVAEEGTIVVLESMKMEHPVRAPAAGRVRAVAVAVGQTVQAGDALAELEPTAFPAGVDSGSSVDDDEGSTRPELAELLARRAAISDEGRPGATARRHERGRRTARENIADLCDEGTFDETGSLVIAAQRGRRALTDLLERTPADGLVTGIGRV